jgi:hypothetical protein
MFLQRTRLVFTLFSFQDGLFRLIILDHKNFQPSECDLYKGNQACESRSLAVSLGCIYLQFVTWIIDLKAKPNDCGESCTFVPDVLSNLRKTHESRTCKDLMLSCAGGQCTLKQYLHNLGKISDPITKVISHELISELLDVTSTTINLHLLLQRADVMRQDWLERCVRIGERRGDWHIREKSLSVWSIPSHIADDTIVPRIFLSGNDDPEASMDRGADPNGNPSKSSRASYLAQEREDYVWNGYGLEYWLRDGRDFKAFSVMEYDPFQTARRELHAQLLHNAVNSYISRV